MYKIRIEDESKNIGTSVGHIDSPIKLIIRTLIISSLNIIDLILSIISFNNECLTFFILKYIYSSYFFNVDSNMCFIFF